MLWQLVAVRSRRVEFNTQNGSADEATLGIKVAEFPKKSRSLAALGMTTRWLDDGDDHIDARNRSDSPNEEICREATLAQVVLGLA